MRRRAVLALGRLAALPAVAGCADVFGRPVRYYVDLLVIRPNGVPDPDDDPRAGELLEYR